MALNKPRVTVAIPVRDEVDRIGPCLLALAHQHGAVADRIVLVLNNCIDGTVDRVRAIVPTLGIACDILERDLHGAEASAGFARSLALRHAAAGCRDHDVLITTDADGLASPNWIAATLDALHRGADAVCGRAEIDPAEAQLIPAHLHEDDARERRLGALIDEIAALLDPDPHDPWPRHTEHSGASIATTVAAWRRAGGMPPTPTGEDRAFIEALRRVDARIRHAPSVLVTVSGRTQGRAIGGMADTIRRRIVQQDEYTDASIEPAEDRTRRVMLRARARALWLNTTCDIGPLAAALAAPKKLVREALAAPFFGQAWATIERDCESLAQRRVRFAELPVEIETALILRTRAENRRRAQRPIPARAAA